MGTTGARILPEHYREILQHLEIRSSRPTILALMLTCRVVSVEAEPFLYSRGPDSSHSSQVEEHFLKAVLQKPIRYQSVQYYCLPRSDSAPHPHLLSEALLKFINLKELEWRSEVSPVQSILLDCTFKLRSLIWGRFRLDTRRDHAFLVSFLCSQHTLENLSIYWTSVKIHLLPSSILPHLKALHSNYAAWRFLMPGRAITFLHWDLCDASESGNVLTAAVPPDAPLLAAFERLEGFALGGIGEVEYQLRASGIVGFLAKLSQLHLARPSEDDLNQLSKIPNLQHLKLSPDPTMKAKYRPQEIFDSSPRMQTIDIESPPNWGASSEDEGFERWQRGSTSILVQNNIYEGPLYFNL